MSKRPIKQDAGGRIILASELFLATYSEREYSSSRVRIVVAFSCWSCASYANECKNECCQNDRLRDRRSHGCLGDIGGAYYHCAGWQGSPSPGATWKYMYCRAVCGYGRDFRARNVVVATLSDQPLLPTISDFKSALEVLSRPPWPWSRLARLRWSSCPTNVSCQ